MYTPSEVFSGIAGGYRVVETLFTGTGAPQQIAKSNIFRWAIMLCSTSGGDYLVSTISNPGVGQGIRISATGGLVALIQKDFASLVQVDFFASAPIALNFTVIEIIKT